MVCYVLTIILANLIIEPSSEYFTIEFHCSIGEKMKWAKNNLVGYVDYCCPDKMSKIELVNMAKELNLDVEGCHLRWLDIMSDNMGLKDIITDADALLMARSVGFCRTLTIYVSVKRLLEPCTRDRNRATGGIAAGDSGQNAILEVGTNVDNSQFRGVGLLAEHAVNMSKAAEDEEYVGGVNSSADTKRKRQPRA